MTKEINKNGRKDDFIILYVLNVDKWRAPKDCRQAAVLNGLKQYISNPLPFLSSTNTNYALNALYQQVFKCRVKCEKPKCINFCFTEYAKVDLIRLCNIFW